MELTIKQDIKLTKQVRFAKLLKPFFPKTYERIMEKRVNQIRFVQPIEEKQKISAVVKKMGVVSTQTRLKTRTNQLITVWSAGMLLCAEGLAFASITSLSPWSGSMLQITGLVVLGLSTAVTIGAGAYLVRRMENDERARIGSELRAVAHSVLN